MDADGIRRTLGRMGHEILESHRGARDLVVVGLLRRGWPVAKRLAFSLTQIEGVTVPCGKLDIGPRRDDARRAEEDESDIPFSIEGKTVVLVDEVIMSGRSIRAALDALHDHGRPERVELAVLVDRGHRKLPVEPNYVGMRLETELDDYINVVVGSEKGDDRVELEQRQPTGVDA